MAPASRRFLRDNAFLVAAVLLPLVVVGFFLLSTAIPRWTVAPPAYDLLVKAGGYSNQPPQMMVDFIVNSDGVHAHVRPVPPNGYPQKTSLFIYEHATGHLRELRVALPDSMKADDQPRDIPVEELAGRRILTSPAAPDGYRFETRSRRGPGILGDLFGMRRYDQGLVLVNGGRVVPLTPPAGYEYLSPVTALGWALPKGAR
jgi:hypothetical protein